ncbi:MAG: protease-like activity factor CPAF [Pseudobdellovibrionaceae bacterium]
MKCLLVLLSIVMALPAFAGFQMTTEEKLADFDQLNSQIEAHYGPKFYKKESIRLDLPALRALYREEIAESKTNVEFYHAMVRFVAAFKDGHFNISIPTDTSVSLPILTDLVGGKVLIDSVDRAKLPVADFPFDRGDEVVAVDGEPVDITLNELSKYLYSGRDISIRRKAAMSVFVRTGKLFPMPENSKVSISVRRGTSDLVETATLEWKKTGTPIDETTRPMNRVLFMNGIGPIKDYKMLSSKETWVELLGDERLERFYQCSGTTRVAIPKDATVLIRDPFVAYYHPTAKGNVGYLRIPHYLPPAKPGSAEPDYEGYFRRYEWVVSELEKNTVGLVIDQDHNCGGSVDYLHKIVSLFMSTPFQPMQFELRASKTEYLDYTNWIKTSSTPDTIEFKNAMIVRDLILKTWKAGDFLTPKTSIDGETAIAPNPVHYTKPIVMLIDEMSGSGGDAFPSLMQGLGRATLIGVATSGLGGHVNQMPSLNNSGMVIRMTQSLFYRPDGVAVENNGAVPDIDYSPTRDDFMYEYKNYQQFYLKALLSKIDSEIK